MLSFETITTALPSSTVTQRKWLAELDAKLFQVARAAGCTQDRAEYEVNFARYFETLDALDAHLNTQRYLNGSKLNVDDEAFALLLWLHEVVFYGLYKLNERRLESFPNLAHYTRDIFEKESLPHADALASLKRAFFVEIEFINPKHRIPLGQFDLKAPHDRELRFGAETLESATEENQSHPPRLGEWKRKTSGHRHQITADGSTPFAAQANRYHLYIANNCPWCHRAALTRSLKGLEHVISMDVLYYRRDPDRGWQFQANEPGCDADSLFGYDYIRQLYEQVGSKETSVPVLWDKETRTIVSNESAEIIRMFDQGFVAFSDNQSTLYPKHLAAQIDRINAFTYHAINNGAYKAGFADAQAAYEAAYNKFFDGLALIDRMLRGRRFLLGDTMTEADVRLFPTIFRFDPVYYIRFNLNARMIADLPSVQAWLERMLANPAIAAASNLDHCRKGYFGRTGNNIVPLWPR